MKYTISQIKKAVDLLVCHKNIDIKVIEIALKVANDEDTETIDKQ